MVVPGLYGCLRRVASSQPVISSILFARDPTSYICCRTKTRLHYRVITWSIKAWIIKQHEFWDLNSLLETLWSTPTPLLYNSQLFIDVFKCTPNHSMLSINWSPSSNHLKQNNTCIVNAGIKLFYQFPNSQVVERSKSKSVNGNHNIINEMKTLKNNAKNSDTKHEEISVYLRDTGEYKDVNVAVCTYCSQASSFIFYWYFCL